MNLHDSAQNSTILLMYFIPLCPCGARSEADLVHARKMKGLLRVGDGGQAPANGSG